jgi:hypothetical protein
MLLKTDKKFCAEMVEKLLTYTYTSTKMDFLNMQDLFRLVIQAVYISEPRMSLQQRGFGRKHNMQKQVTMLR